MLNVDHPFSERIWRGWLEWTGCNEDDIPLAHCHELLGRRELCHDARSMVKYMDAWDDGYRAGLKDARS